MPKLERYGNLWATGIVGMLLAGVFLLVIMAFALVIMMPFVSYLRGIPFWELFTTTSVIWGEMKFPLTVLIIPTLIGTYFASSALINYSIKDTPKAFFDFKTIFRKAFTLKFLIPWIVVTIYSFAAKYVLQFIPYVGGAIAVVIGGVTFFSVMGEAYSSIK